jgi:signal transduction histidine kinase
MIASSKQQQPLPADTESRLLRFTGLAETAVSNAEARAELAASRARLVAAADEERRRVVRDLHDGAQQRLVHTIVTLKLALEALQAHQEDGPGLVAEALDHAQQATDELRELSRGILPTVLTRGGLREAIQALASRMPVPVEVTVSADRLPAAVEATAYFVVAESLTNVAKHAHATAATVLARVGDGTLHVQVRDDGAGGARPRAAVLSGWQTGWPPWMASSGSRAQPGAAPSSPRTSRCRHPDGGEHIEHWAARPLTWCSERRAPASHAGQWR